MLLLMPLVLQAQNHKGKTLTDRDTIPLFRGVAVSFDLVGVIQSGLGDYGQYEAAARLNLRDRYFPVVELGVGHADADDVDSGLRYKTSAPYGRVGVDFNVLRNKHDVNRVYVGGRYGYTSFKYDVDGDCCQGPRVGATMWSTAIRTTVPTATGSNWSLASMPAFGARCVWDGACATSANSQPKTPLSARPGISLVMVATTTVSAAPSM